MPLPDLGWQNRLSSLNSEKKLENRDVSDAYLINMSLK
jgi:hypothetical protein